MKVSQTLCSIAYELKDLKVQKLLIDFLDTIPDVVADRPATSSGKYHSPKDNEPGGLLWHSRVAFRVASTLVDAMSHDGEGYDHIKVAALIHDLGKYGVDGESKHTVFEHPLIGAEMFRSFCSKKRLDEKTKKLVEDVVRLVERHHGRFVSSKYSKTVLPKAEKVDELLLHFADMVASSAYIDCVQDSNGLIPGELPF